MLGKGKFSREARRAWGLLKVYMKPLHFQEKGMLNSEVECIFLLKTSLKGFLLFKRLSFSSSDDTREML